MNKQYLAVSLLLVAVLAVHTHPVQAQNASQTVAIGTAGKSGVYSPVGTAICEIMQRGKVKHGLSCHIDNTGGSVDNIEKMQSGALNFAIVQSDILYYAVNGFGPFKGHGPDPKLRSVSSLHTEAFTVLARADASIRTFDDLQGKRVNVGNVGSGQRTFLDLLMRVKGWGKDAFAARLELPADEQAQALCDNKVDAIVYVVGHPNASIKNATKACETVLVNVKGPAVQKLVDTYPYFVPTKIPGGKYPGSPSTTRTFGVTAVLITASDTPEVMVNELTKTIFNNLTDLKFSHAALFDLTPTGMVNSATAPFHPGALRFIEQSTNLGERMNAK